MKQIQTDQKQLRKQLKRELEQKCRIAFEGLNNGGAKNYAEADYKQFRQTWYNAYVADHYNPYKE
jgi:hypothetical protein